MDLLALQRLQSGIISRRQVLECGWRDHDIRRLLRRRQLAVVYEGIYVDHTGPLTWIQRAWAAVLAHEPAVLSHESALRAVDGPGRRDHEDTGPIHVAVARSRTITRRPGIRVHQISRLDDKSLWHTSPPRMRVEEAGIDVAAAAADELTAIAVLSGLVQSRCTTAARLNDALAGRVRVRRRQLLNDVLSDIEAGVCSALEYRFLTDVERAHGLPEASRQVRDSVKGPIFRDVEYDEFGLVIELDGRAFHADARSRDQDLELPAHGLG